MRHVRWLLPLLLVVPLAWSSTSPPLATGHNATVLDDPIVTPPVPADVPTDAQLDDDGIRDVRSWLVGHPTAPSPPPPIPPQEEGWAPESSVSWGSPSTASREIPLEETSREAPPIEGETPTAPPPPNDPALPSDPPGPAPVPTPLPTPPGDDPASPPASDCLLCLHLPWPLRGLRI